MPFQSQLPTFVQGPAGYEVLPPGCHRCTFPEFYDRFVGTRGGDRDRRTEILEDFLWFREQQEKVGLHVTSYWFDGSFVSDKHHPNDIDFVSLVDGPGSSLVGDPSPWLNPGPAFQEQIPPGGDTPLRVDAYSLVALPPEASGSARDDYDKMKVYWNDWWQRCRPTGPQKIKGYVEVINDEHFKI